MNKHLYLCHLLVLSSPTLLLSICRKSVQKIQILLKPKENNGKFSRRPIHIFIISRSFPLRIRNISDKLCRENKNTHFIFSKDF